MLPRKFRKANSGSHFKFLPDPGDDFSKVIIYHSVPKTPQTFKYVFWFLVFFNGHFFGYSLLPEPLRGLGGASYPKPGFYAANLRNSGSGRIDRPSTQQNHSCDVLTLPKDFGCGIFEQDFNGFLSSSWCEQRWKVGLYKFAFLPSVYPFIHPFILPHLSGHIPFIDLSTSSMNPSTSIHPSTYCTL